MEITPYSFARQSVMPPASVQITVSEHALKDSDERLFRASKNRSRRIHKKLVKRFGGEFRKVPCVWRTPQGIIMHPTLYAEFQRTMADRVNKSIETAIFGALRP